MCSLSLLRGHDRRTHIVNGIKQAAGKGRTDGLAYALRAELRVQMLAVRAHGCRRDVQPRQGCGETEATLAMLCACFLSV